MTENTTVCAIALAALVMATGASAVAGATIATETGGVAGDSLSVDAQANQTTANDSAASVTFGDQPSNGSAVVVNATTVPRGGFVAVYAQNGTLLGNSTYLDPGEHRNVTVSLNTSVGRSQILVAVPHVDTNDNRRFDFDPAAARRAATTAANVSAVSVTDGPYLGGQLPVSSVAFVTVTSGGGSTGDGSGTDGTSNASETTARS